MRPLRPKRSALPTELHPDFGTPDRIPTYDLPLRRRLLCATELLRYMVGITGLEPVTSFLKGTCSIQLSYMPKMAPQPRLERGTSVPKTDDLPINLSGNMVLNKGLEPLTSSL